MWELLSEVEADECELAANCKSLGWTKLLETSRGHLSLYGKEQRELSAIHLLLSSILVWNDMTEYMTEFSFWAYYYVPIHSSSNRVMCK